MAFSREEIEIIKTGQESGRSTDEIKQALVNFRTGIKPSTAVQSTATPQVGSTAEDLNGGQDFLGKGIIETFQRGGERIAGQLGDVQADTTDTELGLKTAQTVGTGALEAVKGAGSVFIEPFRFAYEQLPEDVRDTIGETAESALVTGFQALPEGVKERIEATSEFFEENPEFAQASKDLLDLGANYILLSSFKPGVPKVVNRHFESARQASQSLDPTDFANLGGFKGLNQNLKNNIIMSLKREGVNTARIEALDPSNFATNISFERAITDALLRDTSTSVAGGVLTRAGRQALEASDDVLRSAREKFIRAPKSPATKGGLIKDVRFALSDVDPQVETVLKRSSADEVNRYFQQAKNAVKDPEKPTPLELAGSKAEDAFDVIDDARSKAVRGKKAILNEVGDQQIPRGTLSEVINNGKNGITEKFGAVLDDGTIKQASGRTLQLDNADAKLISEYFSRLERLGETPTLRQVDDFVDWAQGQLYKQSKTLSRLEAASDPVTSYLRGVNGQLNSQLKQSVGGGYAEVNARVSSLIDLQDELSRALGADARKGGGLMKRLFSPTGGNTRRIFNQIRQETGIDLFKEATLAKFAMESVGDIRQRSLLQNLGVQLEEAAELDLTRPLSIVRFVRERADLDAQELANEIIRRSNASR